MSLSNICLTLHRPLLYPSTPELFLFPAGVVADTESLGDERCTCEPRVWQRRSYVFLVLRAVELGLLIPAPWLTGRDVLWTSSVSYFSTFCRTRPFIGSSGKANRSNLLDSVRHAYFFPLQAVKMQSVVKNCLTQLKVNVDF